MWVAHKHGATSTYKDCAPPSFEQIERIPGYKWLRLLVKNTCILFQDAKHTGKMPILNSVPEFKKTFGCIRLTLDINKSVHLIPKLRISIQLI